MTAPGLDANSAAVPLPASATQLVEVSPSILKFHESLRQEACRRVVFCFLVTSMTRDFLCDRIVAK